MLASLFQYSPSISVWCSCPLASFNVTICGWNLLSSKIFLENLFYCVWIYSIFSVLTDVIILFRVSSVMVLFKIPFRDLCFSWFWLLFSCQQFPLSNLSVCFFIFDHLLSHLSSAISLIPFHSLSDSVSVAFTTSLWSLQKWVCVQDHWNLFSCFKLAWNLTWAVNECSTIRPQSCLCYCKSFSTSVI